jgi:hypothetical protein
MGSPSPRRVTGNLRDRRAQESALDVQALEHRMMERKPTRLGVVANHDRSKGGAGGALWKLTSSADTPKTAGPGAGS